MLVPSIDLQDQWCERFSRFLPGLRVARVGCFRGAIHGAEVTVAVVHSALKTDLTALPSDTLLIADEVHRYGVARVGWRGS